MSEDMSDMIQKMSEMLKNNEIPDNIKSIINNFSSGANTNSNNSSNDSKQSFNNSSNDINNSFSQIFNQNKNDTNSSSNQNVNGSSDIPNIDFDTMLKMKSIIDSMNQQQNDPRANLLRSLKPYLKPSRKEKVEQYIKMFSVGKMFEVLNPLGGEKKNDV